MAQKKSNVRSNDDGNNKAKSQGDIMYPSPVNIDGVDALRKLLDDSALRHTGGYYHYTTVGKLEKMLQTRRLFLSHASYLNDKLEECELGKGMYLACFAFGRDESIAMWGNYGHPREEAVRIKISCKAMSDIVKDLHEVKTEKKKIAVWAVRQNAGGIIYEPIEDLKRECFSFHDVGYINQSNKVVEHCRSTYKLPNTLTKKEKGRKSKLSSYLKKHGWAYEHETRLVIDLKKPPKDKDGNILRNIAIDFGAAMEAVKDTPESVTIGPWFDQSPYVRLKDVLPAKCIEISEYAGMVDLPPTVTGHAAAGSCRSTPAQTVFQNCTFNFK